MKLLFLSGFLSDSQSHREVGAPIHWNRKNFCLGVSLGRAELNEEIKACSPAWTHGHLESVLLDQLKEKEKPESG